MRHTLAAILLLVGVYSLTLVTSDPVDLATGALLGTVLVVALEGRLPPPQRGGAGAIQQVLWFPVFGLAVLADVAQGTWSVVLRVLHLRALDRPGIVRVPIGDRSERGVAVSALATTLSPGTVLIDIDWDQRDLLLHVIDASDPDGVRARLQRFYDRYQRRVFP